MRPGPEDPVVSALLAKCRFPRAGHHDVAVSGGADSLALLALALATGAVVTAHHVDHGLRPGGREEAAAVALVCERWGAAFESHSLEIADGPDLEARCRAQRLAVLPAGCLTGHTADDQAETVLLRLMRGTGPAGLAAMDTRRHPLLGLRRSETEELCAHLDVVPLVDPTNVSPRFTRNRVRHEVLPLLADVAGRDVVPLLNRTAELLRGHNDVIASLAAELDPADASALRGAPVPVAMESLRRWWASETGGLPPPGRAAMNRMLAVATGVHRATEVTAGWRLDRSAGRLRLTGGCNPQPGDLSAGTPGSVPAVADPSGTVPPIDADPRIGRVILSEEQIMERIRELGEDLSRDYEGEAPLLVCVLRGAYVFLTDLAREVNLPVEIDFIAVSSYGSSTRTSGVVRLVKDLDVDLTDRHVILVEDIVDTGLTLRYLRRSLEARNPASLEVCALLARETADTEALGVRYVGFRIPGDFVVGYGLDAGERYRNLRYLALYDSEGA